jgi:hypothetical protein
MSNPLPLVLLLALSNIASAQSSGVPRYQDIVVLRWKHLNRNFTKLEAIGPIVFFRVRLSEW